MLKKYAPLTVLLSDFRVRGNRLGFGFDRFINLTALKPWCSLQYSRISSSSLFAEKNDITYTIILICGQNVSDVSDLNWTNHSVRKPYQSFQEFPIHKFHNDELSVIEDQLEGNPLRT